MVRAACMVKGRGSTTGFWGEERVLHGFSNASLQSGIKLAASASLGELVKNRDF